MPDLSKLNLEALDGLSEEEKKVALSILKEYSNQGTSKLYDDIVFEDYEEIPVTIDEFLTNPMYLGKGLINEEGKFTVFPYWVKTLKKIFPNNIDTAYNTLILTGGIGLGKSFVAVIAMLYLLYRMICLKDPYLHYGLQPIDKITFSLINITLDAAKGVAWDKMQQLLQSSPWFMAHGTLKGRGNVEWQPPKGIELIVGSKNNHVIGRAVFCLDGNTIVATENGNKKIKDLVDQKFRVFSKDSKGNIVLSDYCSAQPTIKTNKYYEIELENSSVIKCTANHRFMLIDGSYKEAQYLTEKDELADLNPIGYIYKTENLINGKLYVGQKSSSIFLGEKYLGSGKALNYAIQKYGKENFKTELVCWCFSKEELDKKEIEYIEFWDTRNKHIGYNIAPGGTGGNLGEEAISKMRYSLKHNGNSSLGKICITNEKVNRFINKDSSIPIGWHKESKSKGHLKSEETKLKMKESAKQRDYSNCKNVNKGKRRITNGTVNTFITDNQSLPEGFYFGLTQKTNDHIIKDLDSYKKQKSQSSSGKNNGMYGKGYLIKGEKNGNALYTFYYKDKRFETRKALKEYLNKEGFNISLATLKRIQAKKIGKTLYSRYSSIIDNLKWELKK